MLELIEACSSLRSVGSPGMDARTATSSRTTVQCWGQESVGPWKAQGDGACLTEPIVRVQQTHV